MKPNSARTSLRVAVAGPAMLAASIFVAVPASAVTAPPLPGAVTVKGGTVVKVVLETPVPSAPESSEADPTATSVPSECPTAWSTRVAGRASVVKQISKVSCDAAGMATWTVSVANVKKGTAVVKFIASLSDGTQSIESLVVKIKPPKTGVGPAPGNAGPPPVKPPATPAANLPATGGDAVSVG